MANFRGGCCILVRDPPESRGLRIVRPWLIDQNQRPRELTPPEDSDDTTRQLVESRLPCHGSVAQHRVPPASFDRATNARAWPTSCVQSGTCRSHQDLPIMVAVGASRFRNVGDDAGQGRAQNGKELTFSGLRWSRGSARQATRHSETDLAFNGAVAEVKCNPTRRPPCGARCQTGSVGSFVSGDCKAIAWSPP